MYLNTANYKSRWHFVFLFLSLSLPPSPAVTMYIPKKHMWHPLHRYRIESSTWWQSAQEPQCLLSCVNEWMNKTELLGVQCQCWSLPILSRSWPTYIMCGASSCFSHACLHSRMTEDIVLLRCPPWMRSVRMTTRRSVLANSARLLRARCMVVCTVLLQSA